MVATITQGMSEVVCLPPYNQRIVYSESEETHEDHQLQLLAPHKLPEKLCILCVCNTNSGRLLACISRILDTALKITLMGARYLWDIFG